MVQLTGWTVEVIRASDYHHVGFYRTPQDALDLERRLRAERTRDDVRFRTIRIVHILEGKT